jgi:hypothetical protein
VFSNQFSIISQLKRNFRMSWSKFDSTRVQNPEASRRSCSTEQLVQMSLYIFESHVRHQNAIDSKYRTVHQAVLEKPCDACPARHAVTHTGNSHPTTPLHSTITQTKSASTHIISQSFCHF